MQSDSQRSYRPRTALAGLARQVMHVAGTVHLPPPPAIAAALSGFVVGIVVTLLVTGTMTSSSHSSQPPATLPPATPVTDLQLQAKLSRIVSRQLGPGPGQGASRLLSLNPEPVSPDFIPPELPQHLSKFRSIYIKFRLNDHPLGRVWRMRAARADVFAVLKALYTSQLPVYDVQMEGIFPLKKGATVKSQTALIAYMDYYTAATIPWKRWGRESEGRLWALLTHSYVDPRFA